MLKTFKTFLLLAFIGAVAIGAFGGGALNGVHISSIAIAHASTTTSSSSSSGSSSCSVATAMSDTVSDPNPHVGETITYTLEGAPAFTAPTTITVNDALGAGLTFVSANASNGTYSSSTGIWNVGTLNGASVITLTISATVNPGTEGQTIDNTPGITYVQSGCTQSSAAGSATLTVQGSMTTPTSTPTSTVPSADIAIAKIADVTSTLPGDTVHYTITAIDNGPATSTGVVATDAWPSGLTFVSATTSGGSYASSTGSWTIGTLSASSTATLQIAALVNASGTASTTITNTATIMESTSTIDNNPGNNSSSVSIYVQTPAPAPTPCSLSAAQFEAAVASDTVQWKPVSVGTSTASFTITDHTACSAPISLASYEVFESSTSPHFLSTQQLFDTTSTTVGASSTVILTITLPACEGQIDAFYGPAPTMLLDKDPYHYPNVPFLIAYAFSRSGQLCGASTSTPTSTPSIANLSIKKTVDNATPAPGDTINYTLTVDAQGPATSTDVVATDTLPSGLTFENATASAGTYATSTGAWTIGNMSASSTATLNIAALVDASDTAGQTITNIALVGESPSSTNQTGVSSSSVTVTVQTPACTVNCGGGGGGNDAGLTITKTVDAMSTLPGDILHYTITATASGPQPSTGVVATDTLPSGLTFKSATTSASTTYATSTGTWTIGTLAPNATATLTIAALVNASDTLGQVITNQVTIGESPTLIDTNPITTAEATTTVSSPATSTNEADLEIDKTVDNADPATGSDVNFTVVVTNNGPDTAGDVVAEDQMPIGLATVSATATASTTYNMGTGEWNIGTLSPNATATLQIEAEVSAAGGTTIVNTATVTSTLASLYDPDLSNNSSSVTLNVQPAGCTSNCGGGGGGGGGGNTPSAQIGIVKTVDNADPATGSVIHYTLTVSATGPSASFGVVASDTLPAGITFDSASSSEGSYSNSTGLWTIGTLNIGQDATLVITATVTAPDGTTITNTGTVHESPTVNSPLTWPMTSSVTIDVGGSGGGGGNGGGGGGGQVLGASTSTGQVLGASCGLYLTSYIHPVRKDLNDPTEVKKLQTFLNQNLGLDLPVTGSYDASTIAAVNQFQVKYHIEVLKPWLPLGLPTQFTPTGYVYQTTERWINLIMCPPLNLGIPTLHVDNGE